MVHEARRLSHEWIEDLDHNGMEYRTVMMLRTEHVGLEEFGYSYWKMRTCAGLVSPRPISAAIEPAHAKSF